MHYNFTIYNIHVYYYNEKWSEELNFLVKCKKCKEDFLLKETFKLILTNELKKLKIL